MINFYTKESFGGISQSDFKGDGWYFWDNDGETHGPYPDNETAEKCRKYFDSDGEDQCGADEEEFTCADFSERFKGFVIGVVLTVAIIAIFN